MKTHQILKLWVNLSNGLTQSSWLERMHAHLLRHYLRYIFLLLSYAAFAQRFELSINVSESLPGYLYVVEKGVLPSKGEYASFYYHSDFIYPKGVRFLKRVVGVEGDVVHSINHHFYVNGADVGFAMSETSSGKPIQQNSFDGVIPAGHYYVRGDHPLSLDSRYQVCGLITNPMIIGRGFRVL